MPYMMGNSATSQALSDLFAASSDELRLGIISAQEACAIYRDLEHLAGLFRRYENNFLPVNKLPVEILRRIFRFVAAPNTDVLGNPSNQIHRAVTITKVCSRWRTIVLEDPSMWCHIMDAHRTQLVDPRVILQRSGTSALHVHTTVSYRKKERATPSHVIETYPGRVQALHLTVPLQNADILRLVKQLPPLPTLELLTIRALGVWSRRMNEVDPETLLLCNGETPQLRALHLGPHIRFIPGNTFPMLAHLRLTQLCARTLTVNKVLRLLSNCPCLVTVKLYESPIDYAGGDVDADLKTIALPRLQALWIEYAHVTAVFAVVARLEFPSNINIRLCNLVTNFHRYHNRDATEYPPPPVFVTLAPILRHIEGLTHFEVLHWLPYGEMDETEPSAEHPGHFHIIAQGLHSALWIHLTTKYYKPGRAISRIVPHLYAMLSTGDMTSLRVSVADPSHIACAASLMEDAPHLRTVTLRSTYDKDDGRTKEGLNTLARTLTPVSSTDGDGGLRVPAPMLEWLDIKVKGISTSDDVYVRMAEERALCGHPLRSEAPPTSLVSIPRKDWEEVIPEPLWSSGEDDTKHDPRALWKCWRSRGIAPTFTNVKNEYWRLWTDWDRHSMHELPKDC
ncbi:hypothetical protein BD311DRAFT_760886 [Dichomitus squalens]|uniref:F-box domain-containing protein n=1 Tax=Dichomitus squalens TaxID=114155 RepID=A0A4Q9MIB1_9APHY|nr:hypothetical protein BD311DRAFT_760886 [Dichomitus squalens]